MTDNNEIIHIGGEDKYSHRNIPTKITTDEEAEKLIDRFLMDTQGLSPVTKKRYKDSLKVYFRWVRGNGMELSLITRTELIMYFEDLRSRKNKNDETFSDYTVSTYFIAVKIFYEWANSMGLMINPAKGLKSSIKKEHKFRRLPLNDKQMQELFEHFKKTSIRDYAIIKVMYYCGLRTIEVSRLDCGDIVVINGTRQINVQGKGKDKKDAWVKLRDEANEAIVEYLKERGAYKKSDPIFISESSFKGKSGGRVTSGTISRLVKSGLIAIGLDSRLYTAHGIRHSAATNAIRKGASVTQVQAMLRHHDEKTTAAYIYTIKDEERRNNKSAEDFL